MDGHQLIDIKKVFLILYFMGLSYLKNDNSVLEGNMQFGAIYGEIK